MNENQIPYITFNPETTENFGFEIVPIEKIRRGKNNQLHDPEQPHQLKFYNLIYFTAGSGSHFIDFNWFPVQKHSLIYLTKEQVNAFDFSGNLDGFCMIFTEDYFIDCFANLSKDFVFRLFNPQLFSPILQIPKTSDFNDYFKLLQKEYINSDMFNQKSIINALFTILISKAETIKQSQTLYIKESSKIITFQKFTALIEIHLTQSRNASFYANELAMTYKHLNSICKELVNKTAKNVIDDFIILQAKRRLINSNIKSTELAYHLGFEDATNFTKYFKKHTGFTPKSFLKSLSK
ncbi:transcriptional regulator, AraC family [Formosa agariphila KMM 3901]|uniref:Transcriptional regulator, AraC family n=1 Tax=Formosa agariphila (strain DSM 15362 / KCTC 12365 / LMG 23005 / KMM 3901 / M-2Alg 35-1) TaxID=1347342 RepID=T2KIS2_FORAG|nr:AraC family transcriptional regulator [Formosa agariphila]CDF78710.1 transcriptional regulator, AraC family [Formosa agariphila KMM 3901]